MGESRSPRMNEAGDILVTPRSVTKHGHPSLHRLESAGHRVVFCSPGVLPSEEELLRILPGCVGYLAGVERISARVLASAKSLRVISRNGTGIDGIDLDAARRADIAVCRTNGANARGVAEHAMALIFALARAIPLSDRNIKAGGWERQLGLQLEGRLLGVIGCGRIGKLLSRFALNMDMRVLAHDVLPDDTFRPSELFQFVDFPELLRCSDVISLHAPHDAGAGPILDAAAIRSMKRGVMIVNTARSDLIDNAALLAALEEGQVGGAALDVFASEPPQLDALIQQERVICTPHVGAYTAESVDRAMSDAVENILRVLKLSLTETG